MKFTDGNWLMRPGVQPFYPAEAREVVTTDDTLTVYATRPIQRRGDTLAGPLLTVTFSAPMADVIRVRLTHFAGALPPKPEFPLLTAAAPAVTICNTENEATLTSGKLAVHVPKSGWRVEYRADGRTVTTSLPRGMGMMEVAGEGHFMHEQLALDVGENVYGLGERFTAFVKNGQVVDMWNRDGGTSSEQAYKNVPFYLTNRGYGVFVNHPEQVSFEVASEKVARVQFSVPGHTLEYFVIYGPTPKAILQKYTALTGRPARPPAWSFGLWLTTSFTTTYDEATVTSFIQGMADRDLPLHVFHFDCFWMREFHWCDFEWDRQAFPDPEGMLQRLKARGLRICLWINPYIAQRSPLFAEGQAQGYLLKRPTGEVWQWDLWQPGLAVVDFTNPAARQWYADKLRALLAMGVDCFKTDFGERIPTDVVYHDGSDPQRMHNYYSYLFNQTVFDLLQEVRGEGEAVLFARSATAGGQQFPVHWGGDCDSTFPAMAESLRGGLSLGLSGFGFWSHDIGGFEGMPNAELYKRWIAFGLLSSHSRLHGSSSYRVPWLFDEEAVDVLRHFTKLKCRLMPYLYATALATVQTGVPLMRAMLVEFPDDPTCDFLDRQYMLGENLLVAPVFAADGMVTYYVPAGRWTHFLTGEVKEGPSWVREQHDALSLPLLVRPNAVVAIGQDETRPDYDYAAGVTLQLYALADGANHTVTIPTLAGDTAATFQVARTGAVITVSCTGNAEHWRVLLVGSTTVTARDGAHLEQTPAGTLISPAQGTTLELALAS
ncbi:MAG: alpha-xylosidase [Caldilineaceae bacterium]|nr:alpha-xylosidase [Caldilineaceae bacterium]